MWCAGSTPVRFSGGPNLTPAPTHNLAAGGLGGVGACGRLLALAAEGRAPAVAQADDPLGGGAARQGEWPCSGASVLQLACADCMCRKREARAAAAQALHAQAEVHKEGSLVMPKALFLLYQCCR